MKNPDMSYDDARSFELTGARYWRAIQWAIERVTRLIEEQRALRRAARELASMSDRDLRDIGLVRTDIPHACRRPIFGGLDAL